MIDHGTDVVRIGGHQVERSTLKGIQTASAESGVSFHHLLAKAAQESGFNSSAQAKTSSASGLFQFTRGTWLDMMRRYGAELGFGERPNALFDVGEAARSGDTTRMGISMYWCMLADMMVDDPFALQPSGFSGGDWNSVLTEAFSSESRQTTAAAGRAYRDAANAETVLRQSRSA